jgi:hypothetical protein
MHNLAAMLADLLWRSCVARDSGASLLVVAWSMAAFCKTDLVL